MLNREGYIWLSYNFLVCKGIWSRKIWKCRGCNSQGNCKVFISLNRLRIVYYHKGEITGSYHVCKG